MHFIISSLSYQHPIIRCSVIHPIMPIHFLTLSLQYISSPYCDSTFPHPIIIPISSPYHASTFLYSIVKISPTLSCQYISSPSLPSQYISLQFDLTYNDGDECEFSYYDGCEITSDQLSYDLELTTTTPNHAQQSQNDEEKLIPVGAVCHATGQYVFDHGNIDVKTTPPVAMPPVSCITRPTQLAGISYILY